MSFQCPYEEDLGALVAGELGGPRIEELEGHLADCASCRALVSALLKMAASRSPASAPDLSRSGDGATKPPPLRRGAMVGRYVIIDVIGAGAMGVVYVAYDPELDRRLALKLLGPRLLGTSLHDAGRALLTREAQAMARVSHPNVVTVYDGGTTEDRIFVAMQLIDGVNLTSWLRDHALPWRAVLELFIKAGQGLAAVHRAGLVHRDFKPDNVLVTSEGQVLVTDFGLARLTALPSEAEVSEALLGTPAYMSPEQLDRAVADARSDQFSFCVALFAALFGERPFAGRNTDEIARAIREGRLHVPQRIPRGASHLLPVLTRGLNRDPAARFPDMEALLAALGRDPRRARRRAVASALVILGAAAAVVSATAFYRSRLPDCAAVEHELDGIWDGPRKQLIERAFRAQSLPNAESIWQRVSLRLDRYAHDWQNARRATCEAARATLGRPDQAMAMRNQCLDHRLQELRVLADLFTKATPSMVQRATPAVSQLPPLHTCIEQKNARSTHALNDALAEKLVRVRMLANTGQLKEGIANADSLVREAEQSHSRMLAEALYWQGCLQGNLGHHRDAIATLQRAALVAEETFDDEYKAHALIDLVQATSLFSTDHSLSREYARQAEAVIRRLGNDPHVEARLLRNLGAMLTREERFDEAVAQFEKALATLDRLPGEEKVMRSMITSTMSGPLSDMGRYEEAVEAAQRALVLGEEVFGKEDPELVRSHINLGCALNALGRLEESRAHLERALDMHTRLVGDENRRMVTILDALGETVANQGEVELARTHYVRALAIAERVLDDKDSMRADPLLRLGKLQLQLHRPKEAVPYLERALKEGAPVLGPEGRAEISFPLSQALMGVHTDPARARALAIEARDTYARAGSRRKRELARVEDWLRACGW